MKNATSKVLQPKDMTPQTKKPDTSKTSANKVNASSIDEGSTKGPGLAITTETIRNTSKLDASKTPKKESPTIIGIKRKRNRVESRVEKRLENNRQNIVKLEQDRTKLGRKRKEIQDEKTSLEAAMKECDKRDEKLKAEERGVDEELLTARGIKDLWDGLLAASSDADEE